MENIYELIGQELRTNSGDKYYVMNIKQKDDKFCCLGININSQSLDEGALIFLLSLKNGKLDGNKYNGEDYQSLLDEFMEPENLKQCLEFMNIQRDVLAKENKESQE